MAKIKSGSLGAPADANTKMAKAEDAPKEAAQVFVAAAIVDGPPPMPEAALPAPAPENAKRVVARAIATNPRSPLMAVAGYKQVILYDLEKHTILGALPFPEGEIFSLAFSVSGELLVAGGGVSGDSGCAVVWNVRKADRAGKFGEEYDAVMACDISPDHSKIAIGTPAKKVKVFNVADGAQLYKLEDHTDWIYSVKFSPDGELLATADRSGGLLLWQAANGRTVEALRGHTGAIHDLCFSNDSALLASASADGTVRLWDTWKYTQAGQFAAHAGGVLSVDFADNNELVTTGIDGQTNRWDTAGRTRDVCAAFRLGLHCALWREGRHRSCGRVERHDRIVGNGIGHQGRRGPNECRAVVSRFRIVSTAPMLMHGAIWTAVAQRASGDTALAVRDSIFGGQVF